MIILKSILKVLLIVFIGSAICFGFIYTGVFYTDGWQQKAINESKSLINDSVQTDSVMFLKYKNLLGKEIGQLNKQIDGIVPKSHYILINTTNNVFYLYKQKKLIRKGQCSTGTYTKLVYNDEKEWVFKTPKGKFYIHGKIANPVWIKPDWAFIEEGLPIPPKNDPSRYESGVLGDYAIAIGDGYYIHGTLYKRFLGLPVTHGCIRLNDEDLEVVYKTLDTGDKVFIY